ncbi:MAG: PH domain-containing protein [Acutalibacteraceae bacterium]
MQNTRCTQGKPHKLEILSPLLALPWLITIFCLIFVRHDAISIAVSASAAAILSAIILIISFRQAANKSWQIEGNVLHFARGVSDKRYTTLRLDRISSSEICDTPFYSLFGGTRVRLYSCASPRPVFSMILPKNQAAELINLTAAVFGTQKAVKPRYLVHKKYSALLSALTSCESFLPLFTSALLCAFGRGKTEMYVIAAALWLLALLHTILSVLSECRMSVCHVNCGYAIQTGFFGGRKIFIPDRAIIGMIETRSPIAAICRAGKFELLCAGGRRITCINWYDGDNSEQAACRMIGCAGKIFAVISAPSALRNRYFKQIAMCVIFAAAAWRVALLIPEAFQPAYTVGFVLATSLLLLHSAVGLRCCGEFGISLANGSVRACGMNQIMCKYMTLRIGQISVIKIRRDFADKLRGTCTAEIIPKGRKRGVKCRCLPYERFLAACDRII